VQSGSHARKKRPFGSFTWLENFFWIRSGTFSPWDSGRRVLLLGQIWYEPGTSYPDRNDGSSGDDGLAGANRLYREREVRRCHRGYRRPAEGHYGTRTHKIRNEGRAGDPQRRKVKQKAYERSSLQPDAHDVCCEALTRQSFTRAKTCFVIASRMH